MYTTIGAFHSSNFSLEDATRLSSVGVHLPSSTLCALVTSTGHPLVSPTTEVVLETEKKHLDDGEIKAISGIQVPITVQQEQFVTEGLDSTSKIDVSEFVVRSTTDDQDSISQHPVQARAEMIGGTVLEGNKLTGGFDLCITSMMSHITSETGQEGSGTTTKTLRSNDSSKRSQSLDFRDVHPEDQFAPPAVIFQVCYLSSPCYRKQFSIEYCRTKTKAITSANQNKEKILTRGQSDFEVKTSNLCEAPQNAGDHEAFGFGCASDWLRGWRLFFGPVIGQNKAKTRCTVIPNLFPHWLWL